MSEEFENNEEVLRQEKQMEMDDNDLSNSFVARQIVQEIMNYGVNQGQIKRVLQILCLELEDRELMTKLSDIIEDNLGESDNSHNKKAKKLVTKF